MFQNSLTYIPRHKGSMILFTVRVVTLWSIAAAIGMPRFTANAHDAHHNHHHHNSDSSLHLSELDENHPDRLLEGVIECGAPEMSAEEIFEAIEFEEAFFEALAAEQQLTQEKPFYPQAQISNWLTWILQFFGIPTSTPSSPPPPPPTSSPPAPTNSSPNVPSPTSTPPAPTATPPSTTAPPPTASPPTTEPPPTMPSSTTTGSPAPTAVRSGAPSLAPSSAPTAAPTSAPTSAPTAAPTPRTAALYHIPTYYHIIRPSTPDGREPSEKQVEDQHAILNKAFEGTDFAFVWTGPANRVTNNAWYSYGSSSIGGTDVQMKKALRQGDRRSLNVYINKGAGYCGYAYYPSSGAGDDKDGVVLNNLCFPGSGSSVKLGDTLVHEVGHFLGLPHSFQGGCTYPGDGIDDTPYHTQTSGCPATQPDTCDDGEGKLDPIDNYMNYSADTCRDRFTTGQMSRMISQWHKYRA